MDRSDLGQIEDSLLIIEQKLTLATDLKVQELKMYADELKADNKLSPEEYGAYIKKLNGFKK